MTDRDKLRPPMTTAHFAVFGQIIVGYATCETVLRAILAEMLVIDPWALMVLTDKMNSTALLAKMKAVNAHVEDGERKTKVEAFIKRMERASVLRNEIAHGSWMPSHRSGAIRPTGMSVKAKGVNVLGFDKTEKDYTPKDLDDAAEELMRLCADMQTYHRALRAG